MTSGRLGRLLISVFIVQLAATAVSAQSLSAAVETSSAAADGSSLDQTAPPPRAVEYSDAYRMRAKIHKVSSFATLPLFAAEGIIGQSLYSNPADSNKKDAHLAVAAGIGALFAVNSVTGVWNLIEARKDPNHRKRRLLHGLMMLGADAGFLATAALGPNTEGGRVDSTRVAHRAIAFTSIGLATTGYLVMLFGDH